MKKKLLALLCAVLLCCALLPAVFAADTMYFMAVNDKMLEYTPETMPVISGGTVYIPYTVFLSEYNGGVNLGVFYDRNKQLNTLSLYGRQKLILTFDIGAGTAYDTLEAYSFRAIVRNGTIYVPAWAVCNYFELQYSYLPNDYGALIRVKNDGSYWLDDRVFVSSAADKFREQKKEFDRLQQGDPSLTPTPSPTPTATDGVGTKPQISISFAFRCDSGEDPSALLDALDRYGSKALFLFRPKDLPRWDDDIRRLLAAGHRIGFLVDGGSVADCEAQAAEGNRLLYHIARSHTDFLLVDGSASLRKELSSNGWACWSGNLAGVPAAGTRASVHAATLLQRMEDRRTSIRLTMDDSAVSAAALTRLLPQLKEGDYFFHTITEGNL